MKKLLVLLLALLMVVSLFACGASDDDRREDRDRPTSQRAEKETDEVEEPTEPTVEEPAAEGNEAVAAYVENYGHIFVESLESSFSSSGQMTCTSTIEAKDNGILVKININELEDLTDEMKAAMQEAYDALSETFLACLEELQLEEPAIAFLEIHVCEADGDLIATIYAEN